MSSDLFVHSNLEILTLRYVFLNKICICNSRLDIRGKFQFAAIGFFVAVFYSHLLALGT